MTPSINTYVTSSGATAVKVVFKSRGRRMVKHVGSAHDEAELAVLMEKARQIAQAGQTSLDLEALVGAPKPIVSGSALMGATTSALLIQVLSHAWEVLGLGEAVDGDEGFKQMVFARLVEPTSKAQVPRVLGEIGVQPLTVRTLYRSLASCVDNDWRSSIQAALYKRVNACGDLSLVLYDVTTLYFETETEDDLRKVGFSKERRVDPQITVGMLVDRGGFPLQVGCWEGNHAETKTIVPTVQGFLDAHGVDPADLVVVADAGMMSYTNLTALDKAGLSFIVGSKTTKAPWDLAEHTHFHGEAYTDGQIIETTTPRKGIKSLKGRSKVRSRPAWTPQDNPESWRVVWHYSAKRFAHDNTTLTAQENKAKAVIDGEKTARRPRFVKGSADHLSLDEASLKRARATAGLKGYVTNMTSKRMNAAEVVSSYRSLWHVEQSWRMSKHDLRARPIFHHRKDSIEAHLTMVITALAVARYLQDTTGTSIKKIIHTLKPIQTAQIHLAGQTITASHPLTPQAQTILNALDIDPEI